MAIVQLLALFPPKRFGAALDKTTVIPADGSDAIKLNADALLGGAKDQPDPIMEDGTVVYIPQTRTAHALLFLAKVAGLFRPPTIEKDLQYEGNKSDIGRSPPSGPGPVSLQDGD